MCGRRPEGRVSSRPPVVPSPPGPALPVGPQALTDPGTKVSGTKACRARLRDDRRELLPEPAPHLQPVLDPEQRPPSGANAPSEACAPHGLPPTSVDSKAHIREGISAWEGIRVRDGIPVESSIRSRRPAAGFSPGAGAGPPAPRWASATVPRRIGVYGSALWPRRGTSPAGLDPGTMRPAPIPTCGHERTRIPTVRAATPGNRRLGRGCLSTFGVLGAGYRCEDRLPACRRRQGTPFRSTACLAQARAVSGRVRSMLGKHASDPGPTNADATH